MPTVRTVRSAPSYIYKPAPVRAPVPVRRPISVSIPDRVTLPSYIKTLVVSALTENIDWSLRLLRIGQVWRETQGNGIRVAVIDSGVALGHPDLQGAVVAYKDFTGEGLTDYACHGTFCAGLIAARANGVGIIGIAPRSKLIVAKVLNKKGAGSTDSIAKAIAWAVGQKADVISMSFGSINKIDSVYKAIRAAGNTVYFVAAAGNMGPRANSVAYPAAYPEVISVGAIDQQRKAAMFSSRGKIDIVAPGVGILSDYPPRALAIMSGTSISCPIVAGVVALALAKHRIYGGATPINNRNQLLQHLQKSAIDLGPVGRDSAYGYGLINPADLIGG